MSNALGRWWRSLDVYANPKVRAMLFLGFSSGLPFALVLTTLSARLRQAGIDRTTIGYFSLVGLAYSLKYFWAPVVDRLPLPLLNALGRRRSWMLLAQVGIVAGLVLLALADPAVDPMHVAWLAVFTAFCSSTQDSGCLSHRSRCRRCPGRDGSGVPNWLSGRPHLCRCWCTPCSGRPWVEGLLPGHGRVGHGGRADDDIHFRTKRAY
jgi:hypothetical protein